MRTLIDARTVRPGRTGVGVSTQAMVRAVDEILSPPRTAGSSETTVPSLSGFQTSEALALILPKTQEEWGSRPLGTVRLWDAGVDYERHPAQEWYQARTHRHLFRSVSIDSYWGAAFLLPFFRYSGLRYLVTIHDMAVFTHPQCFPRKFAWWMRQQIYRSIRVADKIHVPTPFVADEVQSFGGARPDQFIVSPLGVEPFFTPLSSSEPDPALPSEVAQLSAPYLLAPGGLDPRKNIPRLLVALSALFERQPQWEYRIVLCGALPSEVPPNLGHRILGLGRLDRSAIRALYRHAMAFLFPSLTEGFGLPVLEAMACGCPVVTAPTGSLPHVGGDVACYGDPLDAPSLSRTIERFLQDPTALADRARAGVDHSRKFRWTNTVEPLVHYLLNPGHAPTSDL